MVGKIKFLKVREKVKEFYLKSGKIGIIFEEKSGKLEIFNTSAGWLEETFPFDVISMLAFFGSRGWRLLL